MWLECPVKVVVTLFLLKFRDIFLRQIFMSFPWAVAIWFWRWNGYETWVLYFRIFSSWPWLLIKTCIASHCRAYTLQVSPWKMVTIFLSPLPQALRDFFFNWVPCNFLAPGFFLGSSFWALSWCAPVSVIRFWVCFWWTCWPPSTSVTGS